MSHEYMPVSLTMKGRKCLVVGGGTIARRKVETLLSYNTKVTVIAPEIDPELTKLAGDNLKLDKREYKSPEAATFDLVIAASDDDKLNRQVCEDARGAGVLVNVVDAPSFCDFIFPAVIRRDCLTASVSTDGKAPFMAAHLRAILENMFPKHWNRMMAMAAIYRLKVQKSFADDQGRKASAYTKFVESDWSKMLEEMNNAEIEAELDEWIKA